MTYEDGRLDASSLSEPIGQEHGLLALDAIAEALNRVDAIEEKLKIVDETLQSAVHVSIPKVKQEVELIKSWQSKQGESMDRLADMISASNDLILSTNQAVSANSQSLANFVHESRSTTVKLIASIVAGLLALSITGVGFVWGIWVMGANP